MKIENRVYSVLLEGHSLILMYKGWKLHIILLRYASLKLGNTLYEWCKRLFYVHNCR